MKVQNKVIIVTGGGNGIGRELVLHLLSKDASVAAVDIDEKGLQQTAALAGDQAKRLSTHVVNIADKQAVTDFAGQVIAQYGAVDGIINNAGVIQPFVRLNDLDYDAIDRVMNVNFYGTLYLTKAFLPHFLSRPEAHIVNVSSMGGFLPVPGQSLYGASKAAVKLLTEGLHTELLHTNVRVTVVVPGAIGTNIDANSGVSISQEMMEAGQQQSVKTLPADKAAQIIVEGMEKNRYRILVGSDAKFMDFIYRLSPQRAANFIFRQMRSLLPE